MRKSPSNRKYSTAFKVQVCTAIRAGTMGWRETERAYGISSGLLTPWLKKFDAGEYGQINHPERRVIVELQNHVAELERMVGRLTIENDRLRTALKPSPASNDNDKNEEAAPPRQGAPAPA